MSIPRSIEAKLGHPMQPGEIELHPAQHELRAMLEKMRQLVRLAAPYIPWASDIEVHLLSKPIVNAVAYSVGGRKYAIGLCLGAAERVLNSFDEEGMRRLYRECSNDPYMMAYERFASCVRYFVYGWLLFHELGHIMCRHLTLPKESPHMTWMDVDEDGASSAALASDADNSDGWDDAQPGDVQRKAVECDADCAAARIVLAIIDEVRDGLVNVDGFPRARAEALAFTANTVALYWQFGFWSTLRYSRNEYPSPNMRRFIIEQRLCTQLSDENRLTAAVQEALAKGRTFGTLYAEISGWPSLDTLPDSFQFYQLVVPAIQRLQEQRAATIG
ncbi:MAG: hypothetical protein HY928_06705 [Elusimicrobia bacterium]|nr:hypothetical protein [Elusimicrobiota bacterium]